MMLCALGETNIAAANVELNSKALIKQKSNSITWNEAERLTISALDDLPGALSALEVAYSRCDDRPHTDTLTALEIAALACQIITTDWASFAPMRVWVERLRDYAGEVPATSSGRLLLASGLYCCIDHAGTTEIASKYGDAIDRIARDALHEAQKTSTPNIVAIASDQISSHAAYGGSNVTFDLALTAVDTLAPRLDQRILARSRYWLAASLRMLDQQQRANELWEQTQRSINATNWRWLRVRSLAIEARPAFDRGDVPAARDALARLRAEVDLQRPLDAYDVHLLTGWLAMLEGNGRQAVEAYNLAYESLERAAMNPSILSIARTFIANGHILHGDISAALKVLEAPITGEPRLVSFFEGGRSLVAALKARSDGDATAYRNALTIAFSTIKDFRGYSIFRMLPKHLALLCADALEQNIEPEFVREWIAKRKLSPLENAGSAWPWPIKVYALGGFRCDIDRQAIDGGRKSNDTRLDLLKLIAANDGEPVAVAQAIDCVWPDADGDLARKSFDMSLSRLRKLLVHEDALQIIDGRIAPNREMMWFDTRDFRRICDVSISEPKLDLLANAVRLTKSYAQGFLAGDARDASWKVEAHERMKQRFVRSAGNIAQALAASHENQAAIDLLARAIETEPLAETLYVGLMRAQLASDRRAEALRTYRRLKETLATMLGVKPSAEADALAKDAAA
ncbi:MAG: AfsR/SARP family transcriptional regulator [Casimicrobium sp.]